MSDAMVAGAAGDGARRLVRALLASTDAAARRLARADDREALHDFRVALRRLRSALRALRPWLAGRARRRVERRLRAVAARTSPARDAEVQLAWLEAQARRLPARCRPGVERARARRAATLADAAADRPRLLRRYRRAARRLARWLRRPAAAGAGAPRLGAVLGPLLTAHVEDLGRRLAAVRGPDDVARAHRARIAGKRARYLLEPLRGYPRADATAAVARLKRLQDVLGELHDVHVLGAALADERERASAAERVGLAELGRRAAARRDALHARALRAVAAGEPGRLLRAVEGLAAALVAQAERPARRARRA